MQIVTQKYQYCDEMQNKLTNNDVKYDAVIGDMFNIAASYYFINKKLNIIIHNFANNERPGLYKRLDNNQIYFSTNTQEEQLLRASLINGQHYLNEEENYPITIDYEYPCALLSTNVIFDKDANTGINLPQKNKYIASVVTCALPNKPALSKDNTYRNKKMNEIVLRHMILCLNIASDADIFITGLWGIGAFCHPIDEIIPLWFDAIKLSNKKPKQIIFVIYDDKFKKQAQYLFNKYI